MAPTLAVATLPLISASSIPEESDNTDAAVSCSVLPRRPSVGRDGVGRARTMSTSVSGRGVVFSLAQSSGAVGAAETTLSAPVSRRTSLSGQQPGMPPIAGQRGMMTVPLTRIAPPPVAPDPTDPRAELEVVEMDVVASSAGGKSLGERLRHGVLAVRGNKEPKKRARFVFDEKRPLRESSCVNDVFLGVNAEDLTERVAVKRFPLVASERQQRLDGLHGYDRSNEARTLAMVGLLRGEGVDDKGRRVLVMRWVEGTSPRDLVDGGYMQKRSDLEQLSRKVLAEVSRVHRLGVVHGDVRWENIRVMVSRCVDTTQGAAGAVGNGGFAAKMDGIAHRVRRWFGSQGTSKIDGAAMARIETTPSPAGPTARRMVVAPQDPTDPARLSIPAAEKYQFEVRLVDYGLARLAATMTRVEAAQQQARDRERAWEAVWVQRHRLRGGREEGVWGSTALGIRRWRSAGGESSYGGDVPPPDVLVESSKRRWRWTPRDSEH